MEELILSEEEAFEVKLEVEAMEEEWLILVLNQQTNYGFIAVPIIKVIRE